MGELKIEVSVIVVLLEDRDEERSVGWIMKMNGSGVELIA